MGDVRSITTRAGGGYGTRRPRSESRDDDPTLANRVIDRPRDSAVRGRQAAGRKLGALRSPKLRLPDEVQHTIHER